MSKGKKQYVVIAVVHSDMDRYQIDSEVSSWLNSLKGTEVELSVVYDRVDSTCDTETCEEG